MAKGKFGKKGNASGKKVMIVRIFSKFGLSDEFIKGLPQEVQGVLETLAGQRKLVITGEIPQLVLMAKLRETGEFNDEWRYLAGLKSAKVSLAWSRKDTWTDNEVDLASMGRVLQAEMEGFGVEVEPQNVEFINVPLSEEVVQQKILVSRDATISECALLWNNKWVLYYTVRCKEDLVKGVGFLNPGPRLMWGVDGVLVPSPLGLARLLNYLANGKVGRIALPETWVKLYHEQVNRRMVGPDELAGYGQLPYGCPLGVHSLILMHTYCKDDPRKQQYVLNILRDLELTVHDDPEEYIKEQEILLKRGGQEFRLQKMTWEDAARNQRERMAQRLKPTKRGSSICDHSFTAVQCAGCDRQCRIEHCDDCSSVRYSGPLPCAIALGQGRIMGMGDVLYPRIQS